MNGHSAAKPAAIQPARVPNRLRPAHSATGTLSIAKRSDSAWVADSVRPKRPIHAWRIT